MVDIRSFKNKHFPNNTKYSQKRRRQRGQPPSRLSPFIHENKIITKIKNFRKYSYEKR